MTEQAEQDDRETSVEEQIIGRARRLAVYCAADETLLLSIALILKNLHTKLREVEFTEDQATQIVSHYQIKS